MTTTETYPAYGQVWKHRKTGREAFVKEVINLCVRFQYFDTGRNCSWFRGDFTKKFTFSHVHV